MALAPGPFARGHKSHQSMNAYVITIGQAVRLKELGVDQKSLMFYVMGQKSLAAIATDEEKFIPWVINFDSPARKFSPQNYAAFTTDELLAMLPDYVHVFKGVSSDPNLIDRSTYMVSHGEVLCIYCDQYPAQALCEYLVYALDKSLITIDDINRRLSEFHQSTGIIIHPAGLLNPLAKVNPYSN